MNKPLVSIIIASYNAEKYIIETLESCINQTYKNIEIIIADDCSVDNSIELIEEWLILKKESHPQIVCNLVQSRQNGGIPANLNNALPLVAGEWIKCLGSDDILLPDAITEFVKRLNEYPNTNNNVGAVFTYFETFGINVVKSNRYPQAWTRDVCMLEPSWFKKQLAMLHFNNIAPCAFINKRYFFEFNKSYRLLEDLPVWLDLIEKDFNTLFFDYTTVRYRLHDSQITSSSNYTVNNILLDDLRLLNKYRLANGYFFAYLHHKFNIYCSSKRTSFYRYLKVINPFNLFIQMYEKIKK